MSIIAAQVSPVGRLLTLQPGTAYLQSAPWTGYKNFAFTVSQAQFVKGLTSVQPIAKKYGYSLSLNPSDYVLNTTHLNAELHYTPSTPATMGWSMRRLTITQVS